MRKFYLTMACLMAVALGWTSCVKTDELEGKLDGIEDRIEALEQQAVEINRLPHMSCTLKDLWSWTSRHTTTDGSIKWR